MSIRVAMWSGPRCLSTAMMRSFESRADTAVWDEPLYAWYLEQSGSPHPMAAEVIAAGITDPQELVAALVGPTPGARPVWYQKHLTHQVLPDLPMDWVAGLRHCMLIRDPRRVVASYARVRPQVTVADVGIVRQAELWDQLAQRTGTRPPVIDCADVLADPAGLLPVLCRALDLPWDPAMLAWSAGPRDSDGVWAPAWYASVWASTGFGPPPGALPTLSAAHAAVAKACLPAYNRLAQHRLQPE